MGKKNKRKTRDQCESGKEKQEPAQINSTATKVHDAAVKPKILPVAAHDKVAAPEKSRTPKEDVSNVTDNKNNIAKKNTRQEYINKTIFKPMDRDEEKEVIKALPSKFKNSEEPITLKDLVSAITKAASDRKKVACTTKKENDLKEELGSLLRQIKMDDQMINAPLGSENPVGNEEGLTEIINLLSTRTEPSQECSPNITESLLDSTSRVGRLVVQGSTESDGAKEESGVCQFCEMEATTKCTGCRKVFYCSRDCQKNHWSAHKDVCRPYKIGKIEGFGRVLVATRSISPEEEVLREKPFVVGPRPSSDALCLGCYRRVSGSFKCRVCQWPMCSESCASSTHHAVECGLCSAAGLDGPNALTSRGYAGQHYELITAIRCLVASQKESSRWRAMVDKFGARHSLVVPGSLQNLHYQQNIVEPMRTAFRIDLHQDLAGIEDQTIHTVLNILQVHAVPSRSTYGEVSGLYPMASLLGHSCVPSTRARLQGEYLVVTATESITAGSPITVMFTDILWGTKARRDHLLQTRFFSCSCRRCSDPTELGSYFSALVCPNCKPSQAVLPTKPLSSSAPWACKTCKYQISGDELLETNLTLGSEAAEQLANPTIEGLETLLKKWLYNVHSNHYHLHAIKHSLLQLYGRSNEKEDTKDEAYWKEISKKERICQEFLKVCSLLDPSMAHSVAQFGLAFYELHKTVLQNAKRNFSSAKLETQQLKKKLQLAKALLRRSMDILKHEAEDTPEGQLHCLCQEEFISIGKWMLASGLV
uniref:Protein msta-like n=1 Tax=Hirondellea gigas TaxID=1518452 RepID=A0A6A7FNI6_9CRUS